MVTGQREYNRHRLLPESSNQIILNLHQWAHDRHQTKSARNGEKPSGAMLIFTAISGESGRGERI
jgi:hypothetical protein